MAFIFEFMKGMLLVSLIITVAVYLVVAFGTKRVLDYYGHTYPWLAFIPFGNLIALTQCMRTDEFGNIKIFGSDLQRDIFQWWPIILLVCGCIPGIGAFLVLAINIIAGAHVYKDLLSSESNQDETVLGWVCGVIPIVWVVMTYIRFKRVNY